MYTDSEVRDVLKKRIEESGSPHSFSKSVGLSVTFVNRVRRNEAPISQKLANILGYSLTKTTELTYEKIDDQMG